MGGGGHGNHRRGRLTGISYLLVMTPTTPSTRDVKWDAGGVPSKEEQELLPLL